MDMSLEDKLAALGLNDDATVSQRTVGDGGGNFFTIPSGRSRNYREDSTLTPGQTPFAAGTSGNYLNTARRAGNPISALWGSGTTHGRFSTPTLWVDTAVSVGGGGGADRF